jgi:acetylcholinesterase
MITVFFVSYIWQRSVLLAVLSQTIMKPALALLTAATQIPLSCAIGSLRVDTTSGVVEGFVSDTNPNVAQFLGIPFAEQPVGSLRWLPPSPLSASTKYVTINATRFGLSCPQYEDDVSVAPNLYTVDAPEFNIHPQAYQGEECLSLNVWTPLGRNHTDTTELFPVIAWIYGGGYYAGGGNVPYQNPAPWIERSGKHIVVGIK